MAATLTRSERDRTLRPARPNAGVEALYRRRLLEEIDRMVFSVRHWLEVAYTSHPPAMATDAVPADELRTVMARLSRQWLHRFDDLADWLANYFAQDAADRSTRSLESAMRRHGFTVRFSPSRRARDVIAATVNENVNLIRSIPRQYLKDVEGSVMRSVQTGRDLGQLASDLERHAGVTRRRAALIARDQNNKATAAIARVRQMELGIERAVWMHSHAGKKPRPTHVKMDGKKFSVKDGMYDPAEGRTIHPGELINCRCSSRPVLPGIA